MNRFFIEKIDPLDKYIILDDSAQLHHLRDVLRLKPKEEAVIFDKLGNEYIVLVSEFGDRAVKLEMKEEKTFDDSGIKITVACAIPKNVKMDDIVDKLTQLGVACIIPLETERVIVRLNKQKKLERLKRWEKISLSALKQSQRVKFVKIDPIEKITSLLAKIGRGGLNLPYDLKLIPTLAGERKTLKEALSGRKPQNILVLIGPEGDFTPEEVALAKEAGFLPVNLGKGVLRVDTAAIAVASFIKLNEEY